MAVRKEQVTHKPTSLGMALLYHHTWAITRVVYAVLPLQRGSQNGSTFKYKSGRWCFTTHNVRKESYGHYNSNSILHSWSTIHSKYAIR